jgi:ABC-type transport system involved in multi-copper enzyme maturation permease subunit
MRSFLAQSGLYVVNFLTLALTVLTSVDTISGEIDSGTIHALAAKPIRRWEILIGKWLGFVGMLTIYLLLMAGGVLVLTRALLGYRVPNAFRGLALMWINELLVLNVTLLGGTRLSTLANGVVVFAAYGVAFIGGWIEQIGAFLGNQSTVVIGILSSLLMPSEAVWRRAAHEMQTALAAALVPNPLMSTVSVPSVAMVIYAVVYAAAALIVALWSFRQRDL